MSGNWPYQKLTKTAELVSKGESVCEGERKKGIHDTSEDVMQEG